MLELFKRVTGAYDLLNIALLYFKHLIYNREHRKQTFLLQYLMLVVCQLSIAALKYSLTYQSQPIVFFGIYKHSYAPGGFKL